MKTHLDSFYELSILIAALSLITLIAFIMMNDLIRRVSHEQARADFKPHVIAVNRPAENNDI